MALRLMNRLLKKKKSVINNKQVMSGTKAYEQTSENKKSVINNKQVMSGTKYKVEKSYIDRLDAWKPRDFNSFNTSQEFFIYQKRPFIDFFTMSINMIFESSKTRG